MGYTVLRESNLRTKVAIVNHKSETNMHYVFYILQPDLSLLLFGDIQGSLHCNQGTL